MCIRFIFETFFIKVFHVYMSMRFMYKTLIIKAYHVYVLGLNVFWYQLEWNCTQLHLPQDHISLVMCMCMRYIFETFVFKAAHVNVFWYQLAHNYICLRIIFRWSCVCVWDSYLKHSFLRQECIFIPAWMKLHTITFGWWYSAGPAATACWLTDRSAPWGLRSSLRSVGSDGCHRQRLYLSWVLRWEISSRALFHTHTSHTSVPREEGCFWLRAKFLNPWLKGWEVGYGVGGLILQDTRSWTLDSRGGRWGKGWGSHPPGHPSIPTHHILQYLE